MNTENIRATEITEITESTETTDENIVIVIDPGHGGTNLGAVNDTEQEKDMTLIVAKAMRDELSKYSGITVYLTREEDADLTLQERADFANEVGADFLFSIHFNASEAHNLYGAEAWVQGSGENYVRGYAFSRLFLDRMNDLGLYERGIKTRINEDDEDWYGVLRSAGRYGITAVLLEHCHIDQEEDSSFIDTEEKLKEFGRLDADAVAEFYGLTGYENDYSGREIIFPSMPEGIVYQDTDLPESSTLTPVFRDMDMADAILKISASDAGSGLRYYSYSLDDGNTWSDLYRFDADAGDIKEEQFEITLPDNADAKVKVRVYDGFDNVKESNTILYPYRKVEETYTYDGETYAKENLSRLYENVKELLVKDPEEAETDSGLHFILYYAVISVGSVLLMLLCWMFYLLHLKKKKKAAPYDET